MKKTNQNLTRKKILTGSALVLAATASVFAQQKPFGGPGTAQPPMPPAPPKFAAAATTTSTNAAPAVLTSTNAVEQLFGGKIPDAIAKGKINVNVRLRYEQADQSSLSDQSFAPTIRTRVGYTTAPLYGFQAMVEGVNVSAIGPEHNYNAAGSNGQGTRPVVADPTLTELNQAWIAYSYTNLATAKVGQQVIDLDNQRFIGDVGWRQNEQTFEAADISVEPLPDLKVYYAYVWDVHRVFGNVDNLPPANRDFDSSSHLINVSYSGWKYGRFVGYSYLLDLSNAGGNNNSCATYGGYFAGQAPITDKVAVNYRAEYAYQTDYGKSTLSYDASYYNFEAGLSMKPFAFGGGYEVLGSGSNSGAGGGRTGFKTPLATLHAFNGWDDVFLGTPADGLQDAYGYFQVMVPAIQVPVRFVYHKFNADSGSGDYGQEYDVMASRKFGKYWTALVKYACYNGQDAPAAYTVNKFWAQVEFNF
jgi:hypothetical protein